MLAEFSRQYGIPFRDPSLLKLALTHRSYLSVTGQGPRESNKRLEFLGDSVLGLVTSEFLYRRHPDEHEGQLTQTKSLLVSKAILSRRALRMGLGRFVLMSHSEVESGGRQRLSILADAFESVIGAVYLDQGFETARGFIHRHLLAESDAIAADKRHTNYKSHLQEFVQSTFRTHPVYRIRSEYGPDHSKHFMVEVMVGKRTLGEGRGHNKKEAEQAAARDALEKLEHGRGRGRGDEPREARHEEAPEPADRDAPFAPEGDEAADDDGGRGESRRRRRRGGRGRSEGGRAPAPPSQEAMAPSEEEEELEASPVREAADAEEADEPDDATPTRRHRRRRRRRAAGTTGRAEAPGANADEEPADDAGAPEIGTPAPAHEPHAPAPPDEEPAAEEDAWPAPAPPGPASLHRETDAAPYESEPGPAGPIAYGRGRRHRGPAAPPPGPAPGARAESEEPRVDPYSLEPEREDAAQVVDVPPPGPAGPDEAPEDAAAREARIEEMERALDSFGRRRGETAPRTPFGRRGRRRG